MQLWETEPSQALLQHLAHQAAPIHFHAIHMVREGGHCYQVGCYYDDMQVST